MDTITEPATAQSVIDAARALTDRWQVGDWRRLTPDARALIEAVLAHDRQEQQL